jgi:hypothetical protein
MMIIRRVKFDYERARQGASSLLVFRGVVYYIGAHTVFTVTYCLSYAKLAGEETWE